MQSHAEPGAATRQEEVDGKRQPLRALAETQASFDALQRLQGDIAQHHLQLIQLYNTASSGLLSKAVPEPSTAQAFADPFFKTGGEKAPSSGSTPATTKAGNTPASSRVGTATSSRFASSRHTSKPGSPASRQTTPAEAPPFEHDTFSDEENETVYAQRCEQITKREKETFALMDKLDLVGERLVEMHFLPTKSHPPTENTSIAKVAVPPAISEAPARSKEAALIDVASPTEHVPETLGDTKKAESVSDVEDHWSDAVDEEDAP